MLDNTIKEWFRNESRNILDNTFFEEAFSAFQKFLEINVSYYDFEGAITTMYNTHFTKWENTIQRFTNIEIYMKALYNTIVNNVYDIAEEDDTTRLELLYKNVFQVVPADFHLTSHDIETLTEGNQKYYAIIYRFRNKITHKSLSKNIDLTNENLARQMQAMIICYLDLAHQKKDQILAAYTRNKTASYLNRQQFAARQLEDWNKYTADFHYIDLKWCDTTNNGLSIEQLADGTDQYIKLTGDAGTGKTTALKYLSKLLSDRIINNTGNIIPVYIPLASVKNNTIILDEIAKLLDLSVKQTEEILDMGEIMLLLDGLNEIMNPKLRSNIEMAIDEIMAHHPKCHVIVTDRNRPLSADKARKMILMEMTLQDKLNYFHSNCTDHDIIQEIEDKANTTPGFFLTLNKPLLLQQFLEITIKKGEIPLDMTGEYLKMLMEREAVEKKEQNIQYLEYYLEDIAWLLANSPERKRKEARILSLMAEVNRTRGFNGPDTLYCLNLAIGMGILQREDDNYISFVNTSYLNYYMNNYVENNDD